MLAYLIQNIKLNPHTRIPNKYQFMIKGTKFIQITSSPCKYEVGDDENETPVMASYWYLDRRACHSL
jgi:hypothetical protein